MSLPHIPLSANGKIDRKSLPPILDNPLVTNGRTRRAPQGPIEEALASIWAQVLKVNEVSATDNFFDLGGQSFEAVRIMGLIREVFGLALSIGDIWQHQELESLAQVIASREDGKAFDPLVTINRQGSGNPCFMVHPAGGNVLCYSELGQQLSRPLFAFQAPGVDGQQLPPESIAEFASAYVERINQVQPSGSILLGGWSSGGLVAYEMAAQLIAQGRKLEGLVILDSPPPTVHAPVNEQELFDWFLGDLNLDDTTLATLRLQASGSIGEDQRLQLTHTALARLDHSLGGDLGQLTTIYRVFKNIVNASRRYQAVPLPIDMLHLRAARGVVPEFAPHPFATSADWGWSRICTGQVTGHFVDASHYSLLLEPALTSVVDHIERWLAAIAAATPSLETASMV